MTDLTYVDILKAFPTSVLLVTAVALNMALYMLRTPKRRSADSVPIHNRGLKLAISATLCGVNLTVALHLLNAIIMFFVIPGAFSFVVPNPNSLRDGPPMLPPGWSHATVAGIAPLTRGVALQAAVWRREVAALESQSRGGSAAAAALPPPSERRWVMWANMNAQGMNNAAPYVGHYAQSLGVDRAVVFNYRGVGASTGMPRGGADLIDDTVAMIRYLETEHDVNTSLLLIHGQSLGATVAVPAAAKAKSRGPIVSDRGFSSLRAIALSRLKQPLFSAFFGSMLAGLGGGAMMQAAFAGQITAALMIHKPWLATQVICIAGGAFSALFGIVPLVDPVMSALGWTLDAATPWGSGELEGERVVIFHKEDGIITYVFFIYRYILREPCSQFDSLPLTSLTISPGRYDSSLQLAVVQNEKRRLRRLGATKRDAAKSRGRGRYSRANHPKGSAEFELHGGCKGGPECHLYPLYKDRKEWNAWLVIGRRLLGLSDSLPAVNAPRGRPVKSAQAKQSSAAQAAAAAAAAKRKQTLKTNDEL